MPGKKRMIPYPTPTSPPKEGTEVGVAESTERWTEVTLEDGTVFRLKPTVISAIRVDGEYDPQGNPAYVLNAQPVVMMISTPPELQKGAKESKLQ